METQDIKQIVLEQGQAFEQFKANNDKDIAELKKLGASLSETREKQDKLDAALDEFDQKLNQRMDAVEVAMKRPGKGADEPKASPVNTAMEKYFRYGLKDGSAFNHMNADEKAAFADMRTKSLAAGADTTGGFLVPEDFRAEVIKKIANFAGVGSLVSRQSTSRDAIKWPKITYSTDDIHTSGLSVTWEDETDSASATDFTLGSVTIPAKKARYLVKISRELTEDSAVDINGLLSTLAADANGVEEDNVFTVGSGGRKPEGFMVNTSISTTNAGSTTVFSWSTLLDLTYALPAQYAQGAAFMVRRSSMGAIRKLVDGSGRYIWEPSVQVGTPATLLGYPIYANEHIPAIASASRSLIFADFKRLYMAVDKIGMSVQRLDEKYADTDEVGFIFRRRVGGAVVAPWAARVMVMSV